MKRRVIRVNFVDENDFKRLAKGFPNFQAIFIIQSSDEKNQVLVMDENRKIDDSKRKEISTRKKNGLYCNFLEFHPFEGKQNNGRKGHNGIETT